MTKPDVKLSSKNFGSASEPSFQAMTFFRIAEAHGIPLERVAPLYLHGDEGRGKKRAPFLVVSWHACLGQGTQLANETRNKKK